MNTIFVYSCVGRVILTGYLLLFFSVNFLYSEDITSNHKLNLRSKTELQREKEIDDSRMNFGSCGVFFSTGKDQTVFDSTYIDYREDRLGESVAYSTDYKPSVGSSIWSNNFKVSGVIDSKAFWKDILVFSGEVMAIYHLRKAHLGFYFLSNWAIDVHQNPYNSSFTTVYKRGEEGIDAVVGTVRFIESDVTDKLPLEKFLNIGLKTEGFEKYEIGLLTIEKLPSMADKKRILLELWVNLVKFFKERNKQTIRVYAFADKFCTRLYKGWGFTPVKEFYKHGVLVQNDETHKDMLKLERGPNMEVLTYVLSKESLIELLHQASNGMLTINSSIVQERLTNLGLTSFFDYSVSL